MRKKREDTNLDSVFNRLQVSTGKKESSCALPAANSSGSIGTSYLENGTDDIRLNQAIGRQLNSKRRKKAPKSVIKKAKLILPKTFAGKQNQGTSACHKHDESDDTDTDDSDDSVSIEDDDVCLDYTAQTSANTAPVSCSTQYLQQGTSGQSSGDTVESNPDELASYFEQILFIPKPMSLMAQMMYA